VCVPFVCAGGLVLLGIEVRVGTGGACERRRLDRRRRQGGEGQARDEKVQPLEMGELYESKQLIQLCQKKQNRKSDPGCIRIVGIRIVGFVDVDRTENLRIQLVNVKSFTICGFTCTCFDDIPTQIKYQNPMLPSRTQCFKRQSGLLQTESFVQYQKYHTTKK
jgi:hypothetical protein